jgi:Zn-dependent protease
MISSIALFSLIILVMSVVIHEVSHGYAAYLQGDATAYYEGRLTLNPLKHIDPLGSIIIPIITTLGGFPFGWAKPVPFNPYNLRSQKWGEFWVAIAGPASNLIIALIFGLIIRFGVFTLPATFISLSLLVVIVNIGLAIFNLIPIPPLDGSKVLFAFLPFHFQRYRQQLERYSFAIVVLLILIPQFSVILSYLVGGVFGLITGISPAMVGF